MQPFNGRSTRRLRLATIGPPPSRPWPTPTAVLADTAAPCPSPCPTFDKLLPPPSRHWHNPTAADIVPTDTIGPLPPPLPLPGRFYPAANATPTLLLHYLCLCPADTTLPRADPMLTNSATVTSGFFGPNAIVVHPSFYSTKVYIFYYLLLLI